MCPWSCTASVDGAAVGRGAAAVDVTEDGPELVRGSDPLAEVLGWASCGAVCAVTCCSWRASRIFLRTSSPMSSSLLFVAVHLPFQQEGCRKLPGERWD